MNKDGFNLSEIQRSFDEDLILYLIEFIFLFLFVWGVSIQAARILGLSLLTGGSFACINIAAASAAWGVSIYKEKHVTNKSGMTPPLLALTLFCLIFGYARSRIEIIGADACYYLSRPAYLLLNPEHELTFDMPGHFPDSFSIVYGIWIPYTMEYLLGFVSSISSIPLITLTAKALPGILAFLIPLPFYALFRRAKIHPYYSIALSIFVLFLLFMDSNNLTSAGGMSLLRTYENKGVLIGFGFPALWLFLINWKSEKIFKWRPFLRVFWASSALCLVTANSIFLIPVSAFLFIFSSALTDLFLQKRIIVNRYLMLLFSILLVPVLVFLSMKVFDRNIYQYAHEVWGYYGYPPFTLSGTYRKVFGNLSSFEIGILIVSLGTICIAGFKKKDEMLLVFSIWAILYGIFILNPLSIYITKQISTQHVVFWRFFYTFPVYLLPAFFLIAFRYLKQRKIMYVAVGAVMIMSYFLYENRSASVKDYIARRISGMRGSFKPVTCYEDRNYFCQSDLVLASRRLATQMVLAAPGARQMVTHGYYLLGRARNKEELNEYRDILKAQHFISKKDSIYKNEFIRVIKKYRPRAVIVERNILHQAASILNEMNYKTVLKRKDWVLLARE